MHAADNRAEQVAAFDTRTLLRAVDDLDLIRDHFHDYGNKPPQMRDNLLNLHGFSIRFIDEGCIDPVMLEEMFDLAADLECRIYDLSDALGRILAPIRALQALEPGD